MSQATAADLVEVLRQNRLVEAEALAALTGDLIARFPDNRALARELVQRGWLTAFQVNQVLQGRAADLVLGPYVLQERLGEGGMGVVFKARHRLMGRTVAIKVIRKEKLQSSAAVKRFQREIEAAAQLNHPNIVTAFDATQAGSHHFLVMEYVAGADLHRYVTSKGPLPVAQACDFVRQAALGLQHAHEKGMVHRDVKPHNLLVTTKGVIKILDMGLALVQTPTEEATGVTGVTQAGAVMGTPDYIAPEQALDAHQADIRADIYSLGCTLYFLLTGRPPFHGTSLTEVLVKHQLHEAAPVEQLRPEVPVELAALVTRMMAKDPQARFQTPGAVAEALNAVLSGTSRPAPLSGTSLDAMVAESSTNFGDLTADAPPSRRCGSITSIGKSEGGRPTLLSGKVKVAAAAGGSVLLLVIGLVAFSGKGSKPATTPAVVDGPLPTQEAPLSKPVYLSNLPELFFNVGYGTFGKKGDLGYDDGRIVVKKVPSPHGLSIHPPSFGYSLVVYTLGKRYRKFQATVALNDDSAGSESPMTFIVMGDGRVLWKSKAIQRPGESDEGNVSIAGVEKLELRLQVPEVHHWAHGVWIEPRVLP